MKTRFLFALLLAAPSWGIILSQPGQRLENQTLTEKVTVTAPDCVIRNVRIKNGPGRGIELQGAHRLLIEGVDIEGIGRDQSLSPANDLIYSQIPSDSVTLRNSRLHDAARCHILARGSNLWTIEGCTFERNTSSTAVHSESMSLGGDGPPCVGWKIRGNTFLDCEGTGVIVAMGSQFEVIGNLFLETIRHGNGTLTGWTGNPFTDSTFAHNTIVDKLSPIGAIYGIRIPTGSGNQAFHNLFIGNGNHVFCAADTTGGNVFSGAFGNKSRYGTGARMETVILDSSYKPTAPIPLSPGLPTFGNSTVGAYAYSPATPTPSPTFTPTLTRTPTRTATPSPTPTWTPKSVNLAPGESVTIRRGL